jgi:hypothetical protein
MRCDVSKVAAAGILAVGVLAVGVLAGGCDSSTVHGSGSPARAVVEQKSSAQRPHQTPTHRHSAAPKYPSHKAPSRKFPSRRPTHQAPVPTSAPPTHAPTQAAPPAPHAADGRNLAACRDAGCQVELVAGDHIALDPALGLDAMSVKSVSSLISFGLSGHGQGLNLVGRDVSSSTNCTNGACTTTGSLSLTPGMTGQINSIHITLTELAGDRAVVTMRPS